MANFAEEMDMDDQEQLFFGHLGPVKREPRATENGTIPPTLGPAKRQRLEPQDRSKGKGGKGKNKGKGKGNPLPGQSLHHGGYPMSQARGYSTGSGEELPAPWAGDRAAPNLGDNSSWMGDRTSQRLGRDHRESADWMEHRVTRLTQLVLRQEQTLANLRQDMMLYLLGQGDDPGNVSGSGQEAMFKQLLISLFERLTATQQDAQAMDHAKSLGWLDNDQSWRVLRWNPAEQSLEVDNSYQPVPTKDLLDQITNVRKAINEDNLLRFKSLRRLSPDVTAEWIQFQVAISLRAEAAPLWATLKSWIGQSSWHTLGCRLRRDRPNYDSLTADLWNYA
ncbi:unnamed protein product [Symbiodinium sp. KB8]|nr:unnamed protein product [Symbiodinium sp. KB8]